MMGRANLEREGSTGPFTRSICLAISVSSIVYEKQNSGARVLPAEDIIRYHVYRYKHVKCFCHASVSPAMWEPESQGKKKKSPKKTVDTHGRV